MGVAERGKYLASIKRLFPQGEYWDARFADGASDVSLFCEAKLPELLRFLERKSQLRDEPRPETAEELIADWERVLLGSVSCGLDLNQRRALLRGVNRAVFNRNVVRDTAKLYGMTVIAAEFPFRPAFFARARFGLDQAAGPAAFMALSVRVRETPEAAVRSEFEKQVIKAALAPYIFSFLYGGTE
ncbi:MAG: DUF2313 domain-containing protein [Treponematales bacterium]